MKVLHLGKFYPPARGGMETILELLCVRTAAEVDNRVLVANHRFAQTSEQYGTTTVVRLPAIATVGAVAVCPALPAVLHAERADLIVLHEPNPMALLAYFLARPPAPLVVWFHSEVIRPNWRYQLFYAPLLRFALSRAARIVVSSPTLLDSSKVLRPWREKCAVIPFGIDTSLGIATHSPALANRAAALRAAYAGCRLLYVGRLVAYKGVDVLLDAMQDIDATLLIVGNGPCRVRLEQQARALGLSERVRFFGEVPRDELAALYVASDALVLPSVTRQEAFGVVLLEAMASGKPVISTDLGTGTSWVNQHGETGIVVPPGDVAALHGALERLVGDPALRTAMGTAALERARSVLNVDRMIASVLDLYRSVAPGVVGRAA